MGWRSLTLSPRQELWPGLLQLQCRAPGRRALWLALRSEGKSEPDRRALSGPQSSAWSGTETTAAPCYASPDACRTRSPFLKDDSGSESFTLR